MKKKNGKTKEETKKRKEKKNKTKKKKKKTARTNNLPFFIIACTDQHRIDRPVLIISYGNSFWTRKMMVIYGIVATEHKSTVVHWQHMPQLIVTAPWIIHRRFIALRQYTFGHSQSPGRFHFEYCFHFGAVRVYTEPFQLKTLPSQHWDRDKTETKHQIAAYRALFQSSELLCDDAIYCVVIFRYVINQS